MGGGGGIKKRGKFEKQFYLLAEKILYTLMKPVIYYEHIMHTNNHAHKLKKEKRAAFCYVVVFMSPSRVISQTRLRLFCSELAQLEPMKLTELRRAFTIRFLIGLDGGLIMMSSPTLMCSSSTETRNY